MTNTAKNTAATPKTVTEAAEKNKLAEETTVPAQATAEKNSVEETTAAEPTPAESEKLTLVQRLKAAAEKLKSNKKAMVILGGAAVIAGLAIKNNLKAAKTNTQDDEPEATCEIVETVQDDESTDSA